GVEAEVVAALPSPHRTGYERPPGRHPDREMARYGTSRELRVSQGVRYPLERQCPPLAWLRWFVSALDRRAVLLLPRRCRTTIPVAWCGSVRSTTTLTLPATTFAATMHSGCRCPTGSVSRTC